MLAPETVAKALELLEVAYSSNEESSWFVVNWTADTCSFRTHLIVEDDGAFLNMRTEGLPAAPTIGSHRTAMLEELNRLNFRFRVAKCMINPMDGELTVTSEEWCADCAITPAAVAGSLSAMLRIIEELLVTVEPLTVGGDDGRSESRDERN